MRRRGMVGDWRSTIGLASGTCLVGAFGNDALRVYTAVGPAASLAASLASSVQLGMVVCDHATWRLVEDQVRVQELRRPTESADSARYEVVELPRSQGASHGTDEPRGKGSHPTARREDVQVRGRLLDHHIRSLMFRIRDSRAFGICATFSRVPATRSTFSSWFVPRRTKLAPAVGRRVPRRPSIFANWPGTPAACSLKGEGRVPKALARVGRRAVRSVGVVQLPRVAHLEHERALLAKELAAAVGLGGRDRRVGGAAERARISATRTIKGAIDKIAATCPALGEHLRTSIRTGVMCLQARSEHFRRVGFLSLEGRECRYVMHTRSARLARCSRTATWFGVMPRASATFAGALFEHAQGDDGTLHSAELGDAARRRTWSSARERRFPEEGDWGLGVVRTDVFVGACAEMTAAAVAGGVAHDGREDRGGVGRGVDAARLGEVEQGTEAFLDAVDGASGARPSLRASAVSAPRWARTIGVRRSNASPSGGMGFPGGRCPRAPRLHVGRRNAGEARNLSPWRRWILAKGNVLELDQFNFRSERARRSGLCARGFPRQRGARLAAAAADLERFAGGAPQGVVVGCVDADAYPDSRAGTGFARCRARRLCRRQGGGAAGGLTNDEGLRRLMAARAAV